MFIFITIYFQREDFCTISLKMPEKNNLTFAPYILDKYVGGFIRQFPGYIAKLQVQLEAELSLLLFDPAIPFVIEC